MADFNTRVVDIDSHVLEPPDLWTNNIEPEYGHRALRFETDEKGWEYMCVDNRHHHGYFLDGGIFGRTGAGEGQRPLEDYLTPGKVSYAEGRPPGSYDPKSRLEVLDRQGIDISILYPTLGLTWETVCFDPWLALAHARVYNDWIVEFCRYQPSRLVPVAHVPVRYIEGAVEEVKRAAQMGCKSIMLYGKATNSKSYGDEYFDPLWEACQEAYMSIALHATGNPKYFGSELYPRADHSISWWIYMWTAEDVKLGFTSFFQGGVFERFPSLKLVVLESGCGWLAHWMERMDEYYMLFGHTTEMKMKPSEYFQRNCWIDTEPDESMAPFLVNLVGADKVMWAGDYPHSDSSSDPVGELLQNMKGLTQEQRELVLGRNAVELYKLG